MSDSPRRLPKRLSLSDGVYDEIMARLFDDSLEPGASLNIDALAREMDVSQTPIREALARLEYTGLVARTALKGYRVAAVLTPRELTDLLDVRAILEPENARRAASNVTPAFLAKLAESIEHLAAAPKGPSFPEYHAYWAADEHFHDLIARQADNAFLYRAFDTLGGQARFRQYGGLSVTDAAFALDEHQAVLAALESGGPESAFQAMSRHVHNVRDRALGRI